MDEQSIPDVRKTVTVAATPEECFRLFTERPADWWPPTHKLLRTAREGLAFEQGLDGRYYEWDAEGNQETWGRIVAWEPPYRVAMTWRIDGRWQPIPDDERASEIEFTLTPVDAATTRVELAHVKLHKHGPDAAAIRRALDGPSPGETLELFAKAL